MKPSHELGLRGEAAAARVVEARGWRVVATRLRISRGEADLYATRRMATPATSLEPACADALCGLVVEVKAAADRWPSTDLVDRVRQARLWRVADALVHRDGLAEVRVVVAFVRLLPDGEDIRWTRLEAW